VQRELYEGQPVTERTEVRILTDGDDADASGIVPGEKVRDGTIAKSDYFGILLDTYHDRQTASCSPPPAGCGRDRVRRAGRERGPGRGTPNFTFRSRRCAAGRESNALYRALTNLVRNAVDAAKAHHGTVLVTLQRSGEMLHLTVRDRGAGSCRSTCTASSTGSPRSRPAQAPGCT
jgi:signal transduction histidine kinase